jgi:hydroxymethylglutaryl-CoA lyase
VTPDILVSEVAPRDGLQSVSTVLAIADRIALVRALAAAGLQEIEVGSFVSPKRLPQMAGTDQVVRDAVGIAGPQIVALVPNRMGAEAAFAAGTPKVTIPVSASIAHSMANVGRDPDAMIAEVAAIHALRLAAPGQPGLEIGISTAFGCTIEGLVPEDRVIRLAVAAANAGADSVGLSDTTGMGNPAQVRRLFGALRREIGDKAGAAHFHDTRGQGLANVVAALDAGVTTFDASLAGLGGCPYAPGAAGNIVTEDLVVLLESMGLSTGVDVEALIAVRALLVRFLPDEPLHGAVARAGLAKGYPGKGLNVI